MANARECVVYSHQQTPLIPLALSSMLPPGFLSFHRFYKCLQSAGAAVAFGLDLNLQPYMTILAVTWALCAAGLLSAAPLIALRVKERTDEKLLDSIRSGTEGEGKAEAEGEGEKDLK